MDTSKFICRKEQKRKKRTKAIVEVGGYITIERTAYKVTENKRLKEGSKIELTIREHSPALFLNKQFV